jgi:CBS domain-containing protein
MADDGSVRLGIRRRVVVGHDHRVALTVFCPRQLRSMHVDVCRRCPRGVAMDENGSVICVPGVDPLRGEVFVGAAMGRASMGIEAGIAVGQLTRQPESGTWIAVVVLDADHRPLGLIDREQLTSAQPGTMAGDLARPVAPVLESAPVMSVVHRMVQTRARALPVVDASLSTVGVVTDIDALRWVTASRLHAKRGTDAPPDESGSDPDDRHFKT